MSVSARTSTAAGSPSGAELHSLRGQLAGQLLLPQDAGYDVARTIWNVMIDRRPALIVRCLNVSDIQAAVEFAALQGLPLSIKGGGHNVAGNAVCENGIMLDLSAMKSVDVDPDRRIARAAPGVLWHEFDRATQQVGLATVGGVVGTTGVAGLTLGGGQGWLTGKYGLSIDNLESVDLVTADGQVRHASAEDNPDLFWAARGAGANFGVATQFEFRLHQESTVLGGMVLHSLESAPEVLRFYREFAVEQPDELTTFCGILTEPAGEVVLALVTCYAGLVDVGENMLAPLRGFGRPLVDTVASIPYEEMQGLIGQGFPHGRRNYWKSGLTNVLSDATIDAMIEYGRKIPSPHSAIVVGDCHGAYSRIPAGATAYRHRDMQFDFIILSSWLDSSEDESNISWTRGLFGAVEPDLDRGVYVNDLGHDEDDSRVRLAYGENYPRLRQLKRVYDPGNLFRFNQNISPA